MSLVFCHLLLWSYKSHGYDFFLHLFLCLTQAAVFIMTANYVCLSRLCKL